MTDLNRNLFLCGKAALPVYYLCTRNINNNLKG